MPTFNDPLAEAAEASESLRSLAHASRTYDDPADTYIVLGDMASGVRSLRQVLDQLANAHLAHRGRAYDDHDSPQVRAGSALAAADELHEAGTLLDQVHDRLDAAFVHSGRIAWRPEPTRAKDSLTETIARRWISVVFLQGEEADEVLDLIDRDGTDAAIEHLKGFDYGDETTATALENGYVYDEPPTGPLDRVVTDGDYTLTSNAVMGHVSLFRTHAFAPDPVLAETAMAPSREARDAISTADRRSSLPQSRQSSPVAEKDWFDGSHRATTSAGPGWSL